MTPPRFTYPGDGPNMELYSGALTPEIRRTILVGAVRSAAGVPLVSRPITDGRPRSVYALSWASLSPGEADQLVRDFTYTGGRGAIPMNYIPDDGGLPIEVLCIGRPAVQYGNGLASVELQLEEQR